MARSIKGDAPGEVAELARLCAQLPLALRIAAERAVVRPSTPLHELIADLRGEHSRWDVLSAEEDTQADAVRSVFAWSYRALPAAAARAFRLSGLHPGPEFGAGVAAALLGESPQGAAGLLDVLAGAHLLEATGPARFSSTTCCAPTPQTKPIAKRVRNTDRWPWHAPWTGTCIALTRPRARPSECLPC